MSRNQNNKPSNATHQSAVADIIQARRKALEAIMKLTMAKNVDWNSPFVVESQTQFQRHPQREAHGYILFYAHQVVNNAYWAKEMDLIVDPVTQPNGEAYEATVPAEDSLEYAAEDGDPDDVVITLDDIATETETIVIDRLNWKWESRQVDVTIYNNSPYYQHDSKTIQKDVLLPPKAITLVFKQLDELAGKLDFLADAEFSLPEGGFKEVANDGR